MNFVKLFLFATLIIVSQQTLCMFWSLSDLQQTENHVNPDAYTFKYLKQETRLHENRHTEILSLRHSQGEIVDTFNNGQVVSIQPSRSLSSKDLGKYRAFLANSNK